MLVGCAKIASLESSDPASAPNTAPGPTTATDQLEPDSGPGDRAGEQHATTFPCGDWECVSGKHACCAQGAGLRCVLIATGCPVLADDAGPTLDGAAPPPPPPPLLCTTYNNCSGDEDCCYDPLTGSACRKGCQNGQVALCTLDKDSCGAKRDCKKMPKPPAKNVGACVSGGGD